MASSHRCCVLALVASSIFAFESEAQDSSLVHKIHAELSATADFADRWVGQRSVLSIRLSRYLKQEDGEIAIFFGQTDMTSLFSLRHVTFTYRPEIFPLPEGETDVVVQLISLDNVWKEIARFTLKVLASGGFEKLVFSPALDLNNKGQVAEDTRPEINTPPRPTYQDYSGQLNFSGEMARRDFSLAAQMNVVGVSHRREALRFGEKGESAPKIDLSNYSFIIRKRALSLSFGHLGHGSHRHLINSYHSRGAMFSGNLTRVLDYSLAAMNGTSIAGWDNFIGLDNDKHRIYSGALGVEFWTRRPGALRLETSYMNGSLLPRNPYNQGNVTDAEKSRGLGVRVVASTASQRLRFEGGFARSRFTNPQDPFLSGGFDVVQVRETTRNAQYVDAGIGVLQNLSLGKNWQTSLTVGYRHERVEPLYRTAAAYVRSDFMEHAVDVQWNIGALSTQYAYSQSEDNLDDVPSILKSKTRRGALNVAVPVGQLIGRPSSWLPMMTYGVDRTHQFGVALPQNAGFSAGHVPDQISLAHNGSVAWQFSRWRIGYRLAHSEQNNRQPGREKSDFVNTSHALSFGVTPFTMLNLNFDVGFDDAESKESSRIDRTRRYAMNAALQLAQNSAISASLATTTAKDDGDTSKRTSRFANLEWSLRFSLLRRWQGQVFARYAYQDSGYRDNVFLLSSDAKNWTVNTGVNFSIR